MTKNQPIGGIGSIRQYNPSVAQFLWYAQRAGDPGLPRDVLDCAAGGSHPPLALFAAQGFETHGIDISSEQVQKATAWCSRAGVELDIQTGDMRAIPFPDGSVSHVYEWHSMCHIERAGIEMAVGEMARVLRAGGLLYAEFMLESSWPREAPPSDEDDASSAQAAHTYFAPGEAESLLDQNGLCIVWSQERATRHPQGVSKMTSEDWKNWRLSDFPDEDPAEWESRYTERARAHVSVELAVICRKA